jgi:hypothetical protein
VGAAFTIPFDFPIGPLNVDPGILEVLDTFLELLPISGKLEDHNPLLARKNSGPKNVEGEVEFSCEVADDGFLNLGFRKPQNENLGIHGVPPGVR